MRGAARGGDPQNCPLTRMGLRETNRPQYYLSIANSDEHQKRPLVFPSCLSGIPNKDYWTSKRTK